MFSSLQKFPRWMLALVGGVWVAIGSPVIAQVVAEDPEIEIAVPFDIAPVVATALSVAVLVMITMAGPKISLQFGKRILRMIGNFLR